MKIVSEDRTYSKLENWFLLRYVMTSMIHPNAMAIVENMGVFVYGFAIYYLCYYVSVSGF